MPGHREIERKFLLGNDNWRGLAPGTPYVQGYLADDERCCVRVRIRQNEAALCVKGAPDGLARSEYEYPIPVDDARELLETCARRPLIEKTRYRVEYRGMYWEIDEFSGANQGLVVAEIELQSEDQPFKKPAWIGREVSGDPRYYNAALARLPYSEWRKPPEM
jgi:CYTH domain-containing protein